MDHVKDIKYNSNNALDIYVPAKPAGEVLVYFHGGGLEEGDKGEYPTFFAALAENGILSVSAEYRKYPQAHYPEFIEDAADAVQWTVKNIGEYIGNKAIKLFLGGTSAGAYLASMLAFDSEYLQSRGIDTAETEGIIINDGQPTDHFNVLKERGLPQDRVVIDDASPIYYISAKTNFHRMLIATAENDIAGRNEQNRFFMDVMKTCGCPEEKITYLFMKGCDHAGYTETKEFSARVINFIKK